MTWATPTALNDHFTKKKIDQWIIWHKDKRHWGNKPVTAKVPNQMSPNGVTAYSKRGQISVQSVHCICDYRRHYQLMSQRRGHPTHVPIYVTYVTGSQMEVKTKKKNPHLQYCGFASTCELLQVFRDFGLRELFALATFSGLLELQSPLPLLNLKTFHRLLVTSLPLLVCWRLLRVSQNISRFVFLLQTRGGEGIFRYAAQLV